MLRGRRSGFAVSLSLLCPGWGHLYAGAHGRAIAALALAMLLVPGIAWAWVSFARSPATALMTGAWTLAALLVIPLDSAWTARQLPPARGHPWRRLLLHGLWVPVVMAFLVVEIQWLRTHIVQLFNTPTESMVPNLVPGDIFFVDVRPQTRGNLRPGDIVVFESPVRGGVSFAKRIVGFPGNRVELREGRLVVDGRFHTAAHNDDADPHLRPERLAGTTYRVEVGGPRDLPDFGPVEVPPEHLFVLGDARPRSNDSRSFGFVPRDSVLGRVLHVFWSWDPRERRVRWERLGTILSGS